jgi:hypothetical protein
MAVYIEYISRRPGVPVEVFHAVAGPGQSAWSAEHGDDRLILNIGRTWRLGSEPEYIAVWHTPGKGANRLGDWAAIFASGEADHLELPFTAVGRIDVAGFYEPLLEPVAGRGGPLYYGEFFDLASGATRQDVAAYFRERAEARSERVLNLAADRIGKLGPDPRGIAFWQLPSYEDVDAVAVELDGTETPIRLARAGLYADIGHEVL